MCRFALNIVCVTMVLYLMIVYSANQVEATLHQSEAIRNQNEAILDQNEATRDQNEAIRNKRDVTQDSVDRVCYAGQSYAPQGFCGDRLTNSLTIVCQYLRANSNRWKRDVRSVLGYRQNRYRQLADAPMVDVYRHTGDTASATDVGSIGLDRRSALSYLTQKRQSGESNIVCECCYHKCNLGEMARYC